MQQQVQRGGVEQLLDPPVERRPAQVERARQLFHVEPLIGDPLGQLAIEPLEELLRWPIQLLRRGAQQDGGPRRKRAPEPVLDAAPQPDQVVDLHPELRRVEGFDEIVVGSGPQPG
ncbi:MAG: hypothetical protein ACK55I_17595, partial [bacterium]